MSEEVKVALSVNLLARAVLVLLSIQADCNSRRRMFFLAVLIGIAAAFSFAMARKMGADGELAGQSVVLPF